MGWEQDNPKSPRKIKSVSWRERANETSSRNDWDLPVVSNGATDS